MAGRNGAQITIQRDPLTGKFPCPCGAPKHARRESNKMRQLCIAANHPGPHDNTVAAEAATDDEDASVRTPDKPLKRRRRPSRKRPASGSPSPVESEEENERRRGKRRAPSPQSSDGDDEIVIVKGPVFRPGAGLTGIAARPETRITAYGGIEQASGSQQATAQNIAVHDQIERQVRRLKDLNERAREQYLESLEEQRFVFIQAADQTQDITRRLRNLLKKQL
ncbi:hypothetical protein K523DRAFT_245513 [Schizophyllum commune Tattone D]|nr:hypothetical protein K525DRAFT_361839 [Schizophyllum commune Loenen D]KAI5828001.1 hypothetical protein K523DRAFT_245513 [Schizophyllum commune Tattone D]